MKNISLILLLILIFISCSGDENNSPGNAGFRSGGSGEWDIPFERVLDGGPGKDGIPALNEPDFISASKANYLSNSDELIIGYAHNNEAKAYSHLVMNWHEIANDWYGDNPIAVIYCPLTGTATGWHRRIKNQVTTFGVSGLLYNANVIPYDRNTSSNWSQLTQACVNGELIGTEPRMVQLIETSWSTWQTFFPNTKVISTETGFSRNYAAYPYGDYKTSQALIFQVANSDDRLLNKERVHSIYTEDKAKVYRFNSFPEDEAGIITDTFDGKRVVVLGSRSQNFIISFYEKIIDDEVLTFSLPKNSKYSEGKFTSSIILIDQFENEWNVLGEAVNGPNKGEKLTPTFGIMGYWFPWSSFYETVDIYEE